jgi:hypothetical protein
VVEVARLRWWRGLAGEVSGTGGHTFGQVIVRSAASESGRDRGSRVNRRRNGHHQADNEQPGRDKRPGFGTNAHDDGSS